MEINSIGQGRQNSSDTVNTTVKVLKETSKAENTVNKSSDNYDKHREDGDLKEKDIKDMVDGLNKLIDGASTHVEYEKHDKFNQYVIKIIDNDTKEVIKEIPPKKILDMVAKMCEMVGIIVDKKA
ncbi:flagellar protein FlaG [Haloimpatiens sp. FM7315]|uniref:flagellar protein FlaG n=1 Tax=Haloimpatiens sp. FM7315 TaxID=3298609 RepID=UPI0035A39E37